MGNGQITRRTVFAAGALGAAAGLVGRAAPAEAAKPATAAEKANLKLVRAFIVVWTAPDFDPDKAMKKYVANDVAVRFNENAKTLTGAAVIKLWKDFITAGGKGVVKVVDIYAQGPLVIAHRIETVLMPGKPDETNEMVGVFFVKNGKIKEWSDYSIT